MPKLAPTTVSPLRLTKKQRAKLLRLVISTSVGIGLGLACRLLPEEYQEVCRFFAKVASLLGG